MTAKVADRLCPGERCLAAGRGLSARPKPGTIESVLEKRYYVVLDGETESQPFSFKKVKRLGKPARERAPVADMRGFAAECNREVAQAADRVLARDQRPPTRLTIPDANVPTYPVNSPTAVRDGQPDISAKSNIQQAIDEYGIDETLRLTRALYGSTAPRPQPRPKKPSRSEAYLQHVREHDCCNCGAPGPSDPDHNGKHGMSQKATDYGAIPLCRFPCHRFRTDRNTLPDPALIGLDIPDREKGRAKYETELIILRAQAQMLREWVEKQEKEIP